MSLQYSALKLDDVPEDQKKWVEPFVNQLNGFQTSALDLLDGKFSLSQNSVNDYFVFRVVGESFPLTLRIGPGPPPTGANVTRVVDAASGKPPVLAAAPHIVFDTKGDQIVIRHVHGLVKGSAYLVSVLLLREKPSPVTAASPQTANAAVTSQTRPVPTALTDWTAWSPEWGAVTTAPVIGNGTLAGHYRRVGDTLQVRITVLCGSTTTYGVGGYLFNLPNGYLIDLAKLGASTTTLYFNEQIGSACALDGGFGYYSGQVFIQNQSQVFVAALNAGSTYLIPTPMTSAIPMTWASTDRLSLDFSVPIVGWSAGDGT